VWAKVGCCRLGWLRRSLLSLAALGILMAISAAAFAPGLVKQCGPIETVSRQTVPLKSFLLLDASFSICAGNVLCPGWEDEKLAAVRILDAFTAVHGEDHIYAGAAQFSSGTQVEASLSGDLQTVKTRVQAMVMNKGATRIDLALDVCGAELAGQIVLKTVGPSAFKVCVLITDGVASDATAALQARQRVLDMGGNIMGIYVGQNAAEGQQLKTLTSCSSSGATATCPWYATVTNFAELQTKAREVAESITSGLVREITEIHHECYIPYWTLVGLLFPLPLVLWWLYLHCRAKPQQNPLEPNPPRKDPERLRVAGANEGRSATAGKR